MAKFFSANNLTPKEPVACCCVPAKILVALVQFNFILLFLWLIITSCAYKYELAFLTAYHLVFLLGFTFESLKMMMAYFVLTILGVFVPFILLFFSSLTMIKWDALVSILKEVEDFKDADFASFYQDTYNFVILAFFYFCLYIYYLCVIWSAIKHVAVKEEIARITPEFDTTQGIYQYNEDAYDGTEENIANSAKLYPLL